MPGHCTLRARLRGAALLCLALLALASGALTAHAQEQYSADTVKAAFLYRFAGYVDWPPEALAAPQFTVAVWGADGVAEQLQHLLPSHPIRDRPAQVRVITSLKELAGVQMLYIGPGHASEVRAASQALNARAVLLVTDDEHGLEQGSVVNFMMVDRRVRFEISLTAADRSGLKISAELLSVAARVEGGRLRSSIFCTAIEGGDPRAQACPTRVIAMLRDGGIIVEGRRI